MLLSEIANSFDGRERCPYVRIILASERWPTVAAVVVAADTEAKTKEWPAFLMLRCLVTKVDGIYRCCECRDVNGAGWQFECRGAGNENRWRRRCLLLL